MACHGDRKKKKKKSKRARSNTHHCPQFVARSIQILWWGRGRKESFCSYVSLTLINHYLNMLGGKWSRHIQTRLRTFIDWLGGWLIAWLIDWLTDWSFIFTIIACILSLLFMSFFFFKLKQKSHVTAGGIIKFCANFSKKILFCI